jgi:hypothetical protein
LSISKLRKSAQEVNASISDSVKTNIRLDGSSGFASVTNDCAYRCRLFPKELSENPRVSWQQPLIGMAPERILRREPETAGISVNDTLVGERWRVGADVIPEASCPRIPCATFQGWLGRTGWIKRFTEAAVPGAFLRVIEPGDIRAGHPVETVSRPAHDVTIALVFRTVTLEPDLLPRLLTAEALAAEITEQDRRRLSA